MTRIERFLIAIALLAPAAQSTGLAQGFLHRTGTAIRDGAGNEVLLRGMGLGGWLVPEGYMLQTSGFADSPTEINAVIVDLVGQANADEFWRRYRANYVTRRDIDSLARWGFNSIRLPMHYNLMTPKDQPGVYLESGFAYIDSLLAWCEANRLYLFLDLHCAPGGQNALNIADYIPGEPSLWESEANKQRTVDLWRTIAARYAASEWIGGYDLINETTWDLGAGNAPLRDLMIRITTAIREVDTNHVVFIEGNQFATDFNGLTPPWDDNMAYSFHKYWNSNDFSSISGYLSLRNSSDVPLWLGESGENSNHWFADCIALLEANDVGWAWWPHKKIGSIAGPLSSRKDPGYNYLLQYWNGQAARPTVNFAVAALNAQAENLKIENCILQPDVIDAVLRLPSDNTRRPYSQNPLPGTLFATHYDMGRNAVAYRDADFQNTGGASYNTGSSFRNDGVDIEQSSDIFSNGFNVGWTAANEFLTYTVDVSTTGMYSIGMRVAAQQAGGSVLLRWDGTVMMPVVTIPSTGGWQSWVTHSLGEHALTAGKHDFRIDIVSAGFNLASVIFTLTTAVGEIPERPVSFRLDQNHPNPFNPETSIGYMLPSSSHVRLAVYDLLGREVARLADGRMDAGEHVARFNAAGLSSGIYVCRLTAGSQVLTKTMVLMK